MRKKTKKILHVLLFLSGAVLNIITIEPKDKSYSIMFDIIIVLILLGCAVWIYFGDYYE